MKSKYVAWAVVALVGLVALFAVADLGSSLWMRTMGVFREDSRRAKFEASKSYNQGVVTDLVRYRREWLGAMPTDRGAIESTVRLMYGSYDGSTLPGELKGFLEKCKYGQ